VVEVGGAPDRTGRSRCQERRPRRSRSPIRGVDEPKSCGSVYFLRHRRTASPAKKNESRGARCARPSNSWEWIEHSRLYQTLVDRQRIIALNVRGRLQRAPASTIRLPASPHAQSRNDAAGRFEARQWMRVSGRGGREGRELRGASERCKNRALVGRCGLTGAGPFRPPWRRWSGRVMPGLDGRASCRAAGPRAPGHGGGGPIPCAPPARSTLAKSRSVTGYMIKDYRAAGGGERRKTHVRKIAMALPGCPEEIAGLGRSPPRAGSANSPGPKRDHRSKRVVSPGGIESLGGGA